MNRVFKNSSLILVITTIGYFLRYGFNVFLAQHFSADLYGDYNLAIKVLAALGSLSLFGTNISAKRFLSHYLQNNKDSTAADYIAWNIKLISIGFLLVWIIAFMAFLIIILLHFFNIQDLNKYHLAIYMLWIAPFAATASLLGAFLLCTDRIVLSTFFSNIMLYALLLSFFTISLQIIGASVNNIMIIAVLCISYLFLSLFIFLSLDVTIRTIVYKAFKNLHLVSIKNKDWLQSSLYMISNNFVFTLANILDLFIIEIFDSNEFDVGYYSAILIIISSIYLVSSNLYQDLKVVVSRLSADKHRKTDLQHYLDKINVIAFLIVAAIGIGIIFFSRNLLLFFGPDYTQAEVPLIISTVGACITRIGLGARMVLLFSGFEKLLLQLNTAEVILNIIVIIPATYFYGITGTAISVALIMSVKSSCCIYWAHKKIGIRAALLF